MIDFQLADLFCGAGGTSTGALEALSALGYRPSLTAINHWPRAVETHQANHPGARHLCTGIDSVNPRELYPDGKLDLLWASPECTHHSRARGGKPKHEQSRATAWCVVRWVEAVQPQTVMVENVIEFRDWGPLDENGKPIKSLKGVTFKAWIEALRSLGYKVEYRIFCAADYGDPTTRKRLFVQAQRGERQIIWPSQTHQSPRQGEELFEDLDAWRAARGCIDLTDKGRSIFKRKKPLALNTIKRIEAGLWKYGFKDLAQSGSSSANPFLVAMEHGGSVRSIDLPINTITTAKGGAHALVEPFLVELRGTKADQLKRSAKSIDDPLGTITAGGGHAALLTPFLLPQQSGGRLRPIDEPAPTVSTSGAIALIEPYLIKYYGTNKTASIDSPLPTVTTRARFGLVQPVVKIEGRKYLLDILFRMLRPRELALCQGFKREHDFSGTQAEQVKQIGNAVPRRLARALVVAAVGQTSDVRDVLQRWKEAA